MLRIFNWLGDSDVPAIGENKNSKLILIISLCVQLQRLMAVFGRLFFPFIFDMIKFESNSQQQFSVVIHFLIF